jgi:hypothetical protein
MYYLTTSDLELVKSTPYLEELTDAKCPPDRTKREYDRNGKWKSTTEDPIRIACYRKILKELMREGVQAYLKGLGERPPIGAGGPSSAPMPKLPGTNNETIVPMGHQR